MWTSATCANRKHTLVQHWCGYYCSLYVWTWFSKPILLQSCNLLVSICEPLPLLVVNVIKTWQLQVHSQTQPTQTCMVWWSMVATLTYIAHYQKSDCSNQYLFERHCAKQSLETQHLSQNLHCSSSAKLSSIFLVELHTVEILDSSSAWDFWVKLKWKSYWCCH